MTFWSIESPYRERAERKLAEALNVEFSELPRLDWSVSHWASTEGIYLGLTVTFGPDADPEILRRSNASSDHRCFFLDPDFLRF